MMIQARTGSGKTGAFVLPMLKRLDPAQRHVQAVILVPTRELARQVWQHANTLFGGSGIESVAVYVALPRKHGRRNFVVIRE